MKRHCNVFISYRRDGGGATAQQIYDWLKAAGYEPFMDVHELQSGPFNKELLDRIDNATDFLVVLTPHSLDRCSNPDDWLLIEIKHAQAQKKNIVPVMTAGFEFPVDSKVEAIRLLSEQNGLPLPHGYFGPGMKKLAHDFLVSKPRKLSRLFALAAVALIVAGIFLSDWHPWRQTVSTGNPPSGNKPSLAQLLPDAVENDDARKESFANALAQGKKMIELCDLPSARTSLDAAGKLAKDSQEIRQHKDVLAQLELLESTERKQKEVAAQLKSAEARIDALEYADALKLLRAARPDADPAQLRQLDEIFARVTKAQELDRQFTEARESLPLCLKLALEAKASGEWAQVVAMLEKPLKALGDKPHLLREAAEKELTQARDELIKRDAFNQKFSAAEELSSKRKFQEALDTFDAARKIWPQHNKQAALEAGEAAAKKGLEENKQRYAEAMLSGNRALAAREWTKAEQQFTNALAVAPNDASATAGAGRATQAVAHPESASVISAQPDPSFVPDPEIEDLIDKALSADKNISDAASTSLHQQSGRAQRALDHRLFREKNEELKVRLAELIARTCEGALGFRCTCELLGNGPHLVICEYDVANLRNCLLKEKSILGNVPPRSTQEGFELKSESIDKDETITLEGRTLRRISFKSNRFIKGGALKFTAGEFFLLATNFNLGPNGNDTVSRKQLILAFHDLRYEFKLLDHGRLYQTNKDAGTFGTWKFNTLELLTSGDAGVIGTIRPVDIASEYLKLDYVAAGDAERIISDALSEDKATAYLATKRLTELGAAASKALDDRLFSEQTTRARTPIAALIARAGEGRVGYRVNLELTPEGFGKMVLESDRTLLAACAMKFDRIMQRSITKFDDDELRRNPYSDVELAKFLKGGMKYLDGGTQQRDGRWIARGEISFTNFDELTAFCDAFDKLGYHMLHGMTFVERDGRRSLHFKKEEEKDDKRAANYLLLFHDVKWEFVLDFKGEIEQSNGHSKVGAAHKWRFNCAQMLAGETEIDAGFKPATAEPKAVVARNRIEVLANERDADGKRISNEPDYAAILDGSASTPAHPSLVYKWVQTSGKSLDLPIERLAKPIIKMTFFEPGEYRFELTVEKDGKVSAPAEVVVLASTSKKREIPKTSLVDAVTPINESPDSAEARKVVVAYFNAMFIGDPKTMRDLSVGIDEHTKNLDSICESVNAMIKFRIAFAAKYGADQANRDYFKELSGEADLPEFLDSIKEAKFVIQDNTATLGGEERIHSPPKLQKINGKWKVDLATIGELLAETAKDAARLKKALSDTLSEINAEKYKTADEAEKALKEKLPLDDK